MSEKLYRGGMPTNPKVKDLLEYYNELKTGDKLPYEELEAIIGVKRSQSRFQTVLTVFRATLEANYGIVLGTERGVGLFVTDDKDKVTLSNVKMKTGKNYFRRAASIAKRVEHIERLSEEDKRSLDHITAINVAINGVNRLRALSPDTRLFNVEISTK